MWLLMAIALDKNMGLCHTLFQRFDTAPFGLQLIRFVYLPGLSNAGLNA
jgi:hypothetical protein